MKTIMSKRTPLKVQQRHASTLTVGMEVTVEDDYGTKHDAQVRDAPWLLGGHTYVVNCVGGQRTFRAYNVMRVYPKTFVRDIIP